MRRILPLAAALSTLLTAAAQGQGLTGRWAITIGTPASPEYRTLEATVARDSTVTGMLGSDNGAVPITSGRVDGARFKLTATIGTGAVVSYDGIVSADTIRGTWKYDQYEGHFIGRRGTQPPPVEVVVQRPRDSVSVMLVATAAARPRTR